MPCPVGQTRLTVAGLTATRQTCALSPAAKTARPSTLSPHAGSQRIPAPTSSSGHGSSGDSVRAVLSVCAMAAMSAAVNDGWRPSGSLGPFLNPPRQVWPGRPFHPGAPGGRRGSLRDRSVGSEAGMGVSHPWMRPKAWACLAGLILVAPGS
jgi:hypothetical protein